MCHDRWFAIPGRGKVRRHLLVFAMTLMAACGNDFRPGDYAASTLRIGGPVEIHTGTTATFTATEARLGRAPSGAPRTSDVTQKLEWRSSNPSVLSIAAGVARGQSSGEAVVTASHERRSASQAVIVIPTTPEWDGAYTLTVTGACASSAFPAELRVRTYDTVLVQSKLLLEVTFAAGRLGGRVINPEARFSIAGPSFYYGGGDVAEQVSEGRWITIGGEAVTTMSPSGFSGTLSGSLSLYGPDLFTLLATCSSPSHGFTLVRK